MAKRGLPPSAFALPGLSKDAKKPLGFPSTRESYGISSATNVTRANAKENLDNSLSLVDEQGSLLPPQTEHTLENLTKTRPRSPRRRSPSPLERRKLEHDSHLSLETNNPQTSIKDHKDISTERVNSLKERSNASPALILSNDVGLSVSSSELSQSRSSPRLGGKTRENRPEVLPKPDRTRNLENGDLMSERTHRNAVSYSVLNDTKIPFADENENDPPPLPTSPPPLEDDEILGSLANDSLNEETKRSFQPSGFEKTPRITDRTTTDLSTKGADNPLKNGIETNVLNRTRQLRQTTTSETTSNNYSPSSRIAKWQGYGRTSSEDNYASGLPKIGAGIPKVGAGFPDRQTSLDSAITSRLSKYETPYNSRQRKPVEKSMSAHRRRFKPVTLTDDTETADSENTKENFDSSVDAANKNSKQPTYEGLHGRKTGENITNSLPREFHKGMDVKNQPLSSSGSNRQYSFQGNSFVPGEKAKQVLGHTVEPSVTANDIYIEKSSQKSGSSDLYGVSRTAHPQPAVVVEYDGTEKLCDNEGNRKIASVISNIRTSNRSEPNELKNESHISENEITRSAGESNNDRNSRLIKEHGSSGRTLPKVVIEYDGVVVNEPLIDGYDTEETSDEGKKLMSSSFGEVEDLHTTHDMDNMSDSTGSLHAEEDDVGIFDYSDEEVEEDITLRDEDLMLDDSVREEAEKAKGM